jgi:hypothetical protein
MNLVRVRVWASLCLVLWSASFAGAQVGGGAMTGVVTDAMGTVTPGATVTATNRRTGLARSVVTNASGVYTVPGLLPGLYVVDVTLSGFRSVRHEDVRVETGVTLRLDVTLTVGNVAEAIIVTAETPALRGTASLGHVVSGDQVVALPLNGRSFITLASLVPGVALPQGSQLPRVNGGRPRTNEYLFDGLSVLQPEPGQIAFFPIVRCDSGIQDRDEQPTGGIRPLQRWRDQLDDEGRDQRAARHSVRVLPERSAERAQLLSGREYYEAEVRSQPVRRCARRPAGSQSHVLLPGLSGAASGHRTHGTVIGADDGAAAGRVHPEHLRPATTVSNGAGGFTRTPFANDTIPIERMDPIARSLLLRFPEPTSAGTANNYRRTASEIDDQNQWDLRLDHVFASNSDRAYARLSNFRGTFVPVTPLPEGSGTTTGTLGPQDTVSWALATNYQHTFASNLLNELRVGDTRRTVHRTAAQLATSAGSALNIPGIPSTAQFPNTLPTFNISGYQILGSPANTASDFNTSVTEIADTLTWVKGRHTFKRDSHGAGSGSTSSSRHRRPDCSRSTSWEAICRAQQTQAHRSPASCSVRCRRSQSTCRRPRFKNGRVSRSTSSRTTGRCRIA